MKADPLKSTRIAVYRICFAIISVASFLAFPIEAFGQSAKATSGNATPAITCVSENECEIRYAYLSNQTNAPFRFLGKIVDKAHPRHQDYRGSIKKFPDATPCLDESEQQAERPNLLKLDWSGVGRRTNLEVCLFRILRSLDDVDAIREWLAFHDFEVRGPVKRHSDNYSPRFEDEAIFLIDAGWSTAESMKRRPSLLWRIFGTTFVRGTSLWIGISESGDVVGVSVNSTIQ